MQIPIQDSEIWKGNNGELKKHEFHFGNKAKHFRTPTRWRNPDEDSFRSNPVPLPRLSLTGRDCKMKSGIGERIIYSFQGCLFFFVSAFQEKAETQHHPEGGTGGATIIISQTVLPPRTGNQKVAPVLQLRLWPLTWFSHSRGVTVNPEACIACQCHIPPRPEPVQKHRRPQCCSRVKQDLDADIQPSPMFQ